MLKKLLVCAALATAICTTTASASTFDPKDLLSKGKDLLGGNSDIVGSIANGLLSTDKISVADLDGTWHSQGPAVVFKSDNVLKKAGGAAATATIEQKLQPYYDKLGLQKVTVTIVGADGSLTMQMGKIKLSGTIEPAPEGSEANFVCKFKAAGKVNVGSIETYVTKSVSGINVMFDASNLIKIVKLAGTLSKNSTVQSATKLLESYDGICAGFKLSK